MYLEQAEYILEEATEAYKSDEQWERDNPLDKKGKGKFTNLRARNSRARCSAGLIGQLS